MLNGVADSFYSLRLDDVQSISEIVVHWSNCLFVSATAGCLPSYEISLHFGYVYVDLVYGIV